MHISLSQPTAFIPLTCRSVCTRTPVGLAAMHISAGHRVQRTQLPGWLAGLRL
jgi:hypothetical protein